MATIHVDDDVRAVVQSMSDLIMISNRTYQMEYQYPSQGADESEDRMKKSKERVAMLRHLRELFEDEMSK